MRFGMLPGFVSTAAGDARKPRTGQKGRAMSDMA